MPSPIQLSKGDAKRAFVSHHLTPCLDQREVFERLRSVQFDPIAPVGCNHDLVMQARVFDYRIGDWEKLAYEDRAIYDGWDKQASLVPFEGWPLRRLFHKQHRAHFEPIFNEHADAVAAILKDLEERGPLMPKECGFQGKREDWKGPWHSSNVTKRVLRALWHTGQVMTSGRRKGQHLYDLAEWVVPPRLLNEPLLAEPDAKRELILERYRAVGLLKPNAPPEVWSYHALMGARSTAIGELAAREDIVPVEVEGVKAHATPAFLAHLDSPTAHAKVTFIAPLDPLLWDRKMIAHVFGFDYAWEIYIPEAKRRWGYYVLPILFDDDFVARAEFWCREGTLEIRRWHFEAQEPGPGFFEELELALRRFMGYCSATKVVVDPSVDTKIRGLAQAI